MVSISTTVMIILQQVCPYKKGKYLTVSNCTIGSWHLLSNLHFVKSCSLRSHIPFTYLCIRDSVSKITTKSK